MGQDLTDEALLKVLQIRHPNTTNRKALGQGGVTLNALTLFLPVTPGALHNKAYIGWCKPQNPSTKWERSLILCGRAGNNG
jgi:hypothetical protein